MRIVSFAHTTPALLVDGPLMKTCTRRMWVPGYANSVCREIDKGDAMWKAYNMNPRFGGKPVAIVHPTDIAYENTRDMPDSDYRAEGFEFFDLKADYLPDERTRMIDSLMGTVIGRGPATPATLRELFDLWREAARDVWVVRFERVEVLHAES